MVVILFSCVPHSIIYSDPFLVISHKKFRVSAGFRYKEKKIVYILWVGLVGFSKSYYMLLVQNIHVSFEVLEKKEKG